MKTTHVFIVDVSTFKYHLEYMFAGTGAKNHIIDFNDSATSNMHHATENNLVGMVADSQRVRVGDYVIFYLQQNFKKGINEGKFFGVFKVKEAPSFLDNLNCLTKEDVILNKNYKFKYPSNNSVFIINGNSKNHSIQIKTALKKRQENNLLRKFHNNDAEKIKSILFDFYENNQFLLKNLGKSLTFRTLIEPKQVYAKGVTEWEALDEIQNIQSPNQMLWSLIYRKLKGNRGNTMITIYESERLVNLIRVKNGRNVLEGNDFTFNETSQQVELMENHKTYQGREEQINVLPRLIEKFCEGKQFETHLQAYILQNIETFSVFEQENIEWIGNEVSCGVGMQRIDIMISIDGQNRKVLPIELKSDVAYPDITTQLQRYVDWIEQYYLPNRPSDIEPMIISREITDKNSRNYLDFIDSLNKFNNSNNVIKLRYVEFSISCDNNRINFNEIDY